MFRYFFDALDVLQRSTQAVSPPDASLRTEAAHLSEVEQSAGIGFWDFDTACAMARWSSGMEAIYGMPKGSFKGTPEDFVSRIHSDDVALVLRESHDANEQRRPFDMRFRIVRPDHTVRWVASRGTGRFSPDGAYLGASGFQVDITEQMQREEQLKLQAQVITTMAEGVLLVDPDSGTILYGNPRYEAMLGYAPGVLQGLSVAVVNAPTDVEPQAVADTISGHLRSTGSWRGEVKNRCADGREIWVSSTVTEMHYEGLGKVWVGVNSDITEQRQAQAARDHALVELQSLSHSVQDKIEAERTALARELHDQLGADLIGMRMQLEALSVKLQAVSPALAQDTQALIAQTRQAQRNVRDICSRLRPALLDDMGLTEACRWYAKEWSQLSGVAVKTRFSALALEPRASSATDMFRVLQELLTNVASHAQASTVRIALRTDESLLVLRVEDNGVGFATNAVSEGFGLMGIRERLRHHGGILHLRSSAAGSRITASMQLKARP